MSFSRHACKRRYTFRWLGLQREFHGLGGGQSADKPSISVGDQHRASEQSKANLNAANQNMSQVLRHSPAQQLAVRDGLTRASLCKSGSLYACFAEATRITKKNGKSRTSPPTNMSVTAVKACMQPFLAFKASFPQRLLYTTLLPLDLGTADLIPTGAPMTPSETATSLLQYLQSSPIVSGDRAAQWLILYKRAK